ncbi:MAG: PIN domain-containing protein [Kiritimatiellales bacterium]|nr:PIN domain-containing protein [Kiritimatiellales bacterium]
MSVKVFIDTNILVYAYDAKDARKHELAKKILNDAWEDRVNASISVQVLQEFFSTLLRQGGDPRYYREVVESLLHWKVIENTCGLLQQAMDVHQRYDTSFYDANIIAAAQLSGAKELWTEDFNTGQDYGGVVAVNPLTSE